MGIKSKHREYLIWLVVGVTALGAITPDLIDKPLKLLGLGDGRTYHEALGYLGIVLVIVGGGIIFTLVGRYTRARILRT